MKGHLYLVINLDLVAWNATELRQVIVWLHERLTLVRFIHLKSLVLKGHDDGVSDKAHIFPLPWFFKFFILLFYLKHADIKRRAAAYVCIAFHFLEVHKLGNTFDDREDELRSKWGIQVWVKGL